MGEKKRRLAAGGPLIQRPSPIELMMPIRADVSANSRLHYMERARKVKAQREAVAWLLSRKRPPPEPIVVHLTRFSPAQALPDDDNVVTSMKGVRDAIAAWAGIDDRDRSRIRFVYEDPVRGPWAVKAVIQSA